MSAMYAVATVKLAPVIPAKIRPTNSTTTSPTLSIALDDLFSMLVGLQLPLWAISEPVSIELVLNRQHNTAGDVGKVAKQLAALELNVNKMMG